MHAVHGHHENGLTLAGRADARAAATVASYCCSALAVAARCLVRSSASLAFSWAFSAFCNAIPRPSGTDSKEHASSYRCHVCLQQQIFRGGACYPCKSMQVATCWSRCCRRRMASSAAGALAASCSASNLAKSASCAARISSTSLACASLPHQHDIRIFHMDLRLTVITCSL